MTVIVNNTGVSDGLFRALSVDNYSRGEADISVTQLISPPRIVTLHERHDAEIEEEASDVIYRMFGKIVHEILEAEKLTLAGDNHEYRNRNINEVMQRFIKNELPLESLSEAISKAIAEADAQKVLEEHELLFEHRMFVSDLNGWTLSGSADHLNLRDQSIHDYKVCSRWKANDSDFTEWTAQQNVYIWLAHRNGITIKTAAIEGIFRDWTKTAAYRDKEYPQAQTQIFPIEVWPLDKTEQYINERIHLHQEARKMDDEILPMCSSEERWVTLGKFAVEKKGRKSAIRLLDSHADAEQWIKEHIKDGEVLSIVRREGDSTRCRHYCPVWKFCEYGRYIHKGM